MLFQGKVTWMVFTILLLAGRGWAAVFPEDPYSTLPDASLSAPPEVCAGSGELTFNVCEGSPPFTIYYTADDGTTVDVDTVTVNSTGHTIDIYPVKDVTYSITYIKDATDAERTTNFSPAATAHVTVNPLPDASLDVSSTLVCEGEDTDLIFTFCQGTSPFTATYSITTSEGTTFKTVEGLENGSTVGITADKNATYTITAVTDADGCTRTSGFNTPEITESVTVNPLPTGRLVARDRDICSGETATLVFESAPGKTFDIVYSDGTGQHTLVNIENGDFIHVTPEQSTHYALVSLKGEHCKRTGGFDDDAAVNVHTPVSFSAKTVCAGEATVFTIENGIAGNTYEWDFNGDGVVDKSTTETVASYVYQDEGPYQATLSTGSSAVCSGTVTKDLAIPVAPAVFAGNDTTLIKGDHFSIPATANGHYSYRWSPETGLSSPDILSPEVSPTVTTLYTLTATNAEGCTASAEILVTVTEPEEEQPGPLKIYNSFTPDNDHYNDVWIIDGIEAYPDNMVAIFDRWGNRLFLSRGYNDPWDGTSKGKRLDPGTYYYVVSLNDGTPPMKGTVNIIR